MQQLDDLVSLEKLKASGLTVVLTTHYMEEASHMCDRLVIVDHGRILVEGSPEELILKHAGRSVIEVADPDPALREHLKTHRLPHDDLGRRLILYTPDGNEQAVSLRETFCAATCTVRNGTLEDVFLRLTGRELRE
jgi:lipooligosaccharide transport system ATP-binding protein